MIDKAHALSVSRQSTLLKISRGTVYYLPKPVSPSDLALMRHIDELHLEHPVMGARMLRINIQAIAPQPGTSKAQPGNKIYPYLLRHLPINYG